VIDATEWVGCAAWAAFVWHIYSRKHTLAPYWLAHRAHRKYAHGTVASSISVALFLFPVDSKHAANQPNWLTVPRKNHYTYFFNLPLLLAGGDGVLKGRRAANYIVMAAWACEREWMAKSLQARLSPRPVLRQKRTPGTNFLQPPLELHFAY
jgi:hypothetical protein